MKVAQRDTPGYSEACLAGMLESFFFPSSFFDQPVCVRGICFAAGAESERLACEFAAGHLKLGTIVLRMGAVTSEDWRAIAVLLRPPKANVSNVAVILPNLDLASGEVQEKLGEVVDAAEGIVWLPTVNDQRGISARLKQHFLVYLGLSRDDKMQFLLQSGQRIQIDEGSLKQPAN